MEIEHFVGIGAILAISVLLVWIVWSCFCSQDKTDLEEEDEEDYDPSHSDNFSSTHQITRSVIIIIIIKLLCIANCGCNEVNLICKAIHYFFINFEQKITTALFRLLKLNENLNARSSN